MITELNKIEAEIVGGRRIDVVEHQVRNFRLQSVLEQMSRLFLFCLECDSNNTSSKAIPSDVRKIRAQFDIVQDEFDFSSDPQHNDNPQTAHEYAYAIDLIDTKEIQRIRNVKLKRVVAEMYRCAQVILDVDSANTQAYLDTGDQDSIRTCFNTVSNAMDRWIGEGAGPDDTGIYAPAFAQLGEVVPDVDGDWSETLEPSKSMPRPKLPDSVDTE